MWPAAVSLVLAGVGPLAAGTEGRIVGTVVDRAGNPLKGAQVVVSAVEVELQETRTTNKKGQFIIILLDLSRDFVIRIGKEGYLPIEEPLKPKLGQTIRPTWTLVEGEPPREGIGEAPSEIDAANRVVKLYRAGQEAYDDGELETAIEKFDQVRELAPELWEPHMGLAMAYFRMEENEKAAAAAARLLEMKEGDVIGLRVQYEANRALGNSELEAAALAQLEVVEPGPETARRVFNSGVTHVQAGELEAAVGRFELAVEMDPELAPGYAALTRVYLRLGDQEKSVANGERAIELQPDDAGILHLLYGLYRGRGETDKADAAFASMREASPQYVSDQFHEQGVNLFYDGDTAAAQEIFQRVVEALPEHPQAHYMLALCLVNAGELASAKHHLSRFLELAPDDPEAATARQMLASL